MSILKFFSSKEKYNSIITFYSIMNLDEVLHYRRSVRGIVSGNKVTDKFARAGFHATRSEFVDAPLIDELSVAVECKLKDYNPETCILRGEIVNVSVDERVLDENGKVDASKVAPIIFDPFNNDYLKVGERVGKAFSDGKALK